MSTRLALVDCNNFFCSCERVFDPSLLGKPLIVLSNNDGCIISRSDEAKQLGIPMGAPLHEQQQLINRHGVRVFSSNYTLYGDLSDRVMSILRMEVPSMEVYSIDEAFLHLPEGFHEEEARLLRAKVLQWMGIPVCIGMGSTKLLAKFANRHAKSHKAITGGVFDLCAHGNVEELMAEAPCESLWGVAARTAANLARLGIGSVLDFKRADPALIRKALGVIGERLQQELNGISCLEQEELPPARNGVMASRSFGSPVESLEVLGEALANHVSHASERIRRFGLLATHLEIFLQTNRFRKDLPQYSPIRGISLKTPTSSTAELMTVARQLLESLYKEGYRYKKAGVMLTGLVSTDSYQPSLFDPPPRLDIDKIVDEINRKMGDPKHPVLIRGAMGSDRLGRSWKMKSKLHSPNYTTDWKELLHVKA